VRPAECPQVLVGFLHFRFAHRGVITGLVPVRCAVDVARLELDARQLIGNSSRRLEVRLRYQRVKRLLLVFLRFGRIALEHIRKRHHPQCAVLLVCRSHLDRFLQVFARPLDVTGEVVGIAEIVAENGVARFELDRQNACPLVLVVVWGTGVAWEGFVGNLRPGPALVLHVLAEAGPNFLGRRGIHLEQLGNVNQLQPGTVQANPSGTNPDSLRPYRGYSTIIEAQNVGGSNYHSLQANLKRRLTKGFLFGVAYTWSKSLDYASSNGTNVPNVYNIGINYGPSDFDTRHVLVTNYVWDIPYATHSTNRLVRSTLGDWQFSGTIQAQSGRPPSNGISNGNDRAGVGPGSGNQYWVQTRKPNLPHQFAGTGTAQWFESAAYAPAPLGTFAPRGSRNNIYGPGFNSFSSALQKSMHVIPGHDNHALVFRAEAFNYLNHPNLDNPDVSPTSGTFGRVTSKGVTYASERQLQFSLRYAF